MPYFYLGLLSSHSYWSDDGKRPVFCKRDTERFEYCNSYDTAAFGLYQGSPLDEYCNRALPKETLSRRINDQAMMRFRTRLDLPFLGDFMLALRDHFIGVQPAFL